MRGPVGYAFVCECLDPPDRSKLIELIHFRVMPYWLVKQINGTPLRSGDLAARGRALTALSNLRYVFGRWKGAGLPVPPVAVAAELREGAQAGFSGR